MNNPTAAKARTGSALHTLLSRLSADEQALLAPILQALHALGYRPRKLKTKGIMLSFTHPAHGRQIARLGIRQGAQDALFALRFSGCVRYPPRLAAIVRDRLLRDDGSSHPPMCPQCRLCVGEPHRYTHPFADGVARSHCGAYAFEIPGICAEDVPGILQTLTEQHAYFMKNASGSSTHESGGET